MKRIYYDYEQFREEDGILERPFYSVPYLCIFATEGGEGFFACRQIPDLASEEPIYYVPGREKVYQVAESLEELISGGQRWQKKMRWFYSTAYNWKRKLSYNGLGGYRHTKLLTNAN